MKFAKMVTSITRIGLLFYLCLVSQGHPTIEKHQLPQEDKQLEEEVFKSSKIYWSEVTLAALERVVTYFEHNLDHFVLDGVFGMRIAQGQLEDLLLEFKEGHINASASLLNAVYDVTMRTERACHKAMPFLAASEASYYSMFSKLVTKAFHVDATLQQRRLGTATRLPAAAGTKPMLDVTHDSGVKSDVDAQSHAYVEDNGDACLALLMGTSARQSTEKCVITADCADLMVKDANGAGYLGSHQLLYSLLAQHESCTYVYEMYLPSATNIDMFQANQCRLLYQEANSIMEKNIPDVNRDLFLELITLCGVAGSDDFYRENWLKEILQWQEADSGCFKFRRQDGTFTMRKLTRDLTTEDGCSSHMTGLAAATMTLHLRYLLEHNDTFPTNWPAGTAADNR